MYALSDTSRSATWHELDDMQRRDELGAERLSSSPRRSTDSTGVQRQASDQRQSESSLDHSISLPNIGDGIGPPRLTRMRSSLDSYEAAVFPVSDLFDHTSGVQPPAILKGLEVVGVPKVCSLSASSLSHLPPSPPCPG